MILDWTHTAFYAVADSPCKGWSFCIQKMADGVFNAYVSSQPAGISDVKGYLIAQGLSHTAAMNYCEKWLDERDRPAWQVTELTACATWRGFGMIAYPRMRDVGFYGWAHSRSGDQTRTVPKNFPTLEEAMAAIEAEVRMATAS